MAIALASILGKTHPKLAVDALKRFRDRRDMANRLRRFNRGLLASDDELRSIARCGNALGAFVKLRRSRDGNIRPMYVATCKSAWGCLGCAARRRAEKAAIVQWYVNRHLEAGKAVSFASFTLAHYATDNLTDLLTGLRDAFTDMRNLKTYKDAVQEYGIDGWIAALEITDGDNGWHPHLHVLFFHEEFLQMEYGDNADLKAALHELFSRQVDRHLGRQVHQIYGVDLVPVKTAGGDDDVLARYLGKIQLEMTRQDLKTGRASSSRSPWEIGLDAATTGDSRDTARWVEYLRATKGRNVMTRAKSLTDLYGEPTEAELLELQGIDLDDDLGAEMDSDKDGEDACEDVATVDGQLWNDAKWAITPDGRTILGAALSALEDDGPEAMADVLSRHLGPIHVVDDHPDTKLPHLEYTDRPTPLIVVEGSEDGDDDPIDYDQLGPAARAWYGIRDSEPTERRST